jgi:RHS repeat-associated protein
VGANPTAYYLYNGHGDVTGILDAAGATVAAYDYDAFGKLTTNTGTFDNPYLYAGEYYDYTTSEYYLRARFYSPQLGRFISQDTYQGQYDDPLSLHQYTYVRNNPMTYVDPTGHMIDDGGGSGGEDPAPEQAAPPEQTFLDIAADRATQFVTDVALIGGGVVYQWTNDNAFNAIEATQTFGGMNPDQLPFQFQIGRVIGDGAAIFTGTVEAGLGVIGDIGSGLGAFFTGGASLAGAVPSTAAVVHGGSSAINGLRNFGRDIDNSKGADRFDVVYSKGQGRYSDGTVSPSPGKIEGPDPAAEGRPHTVLKWDDTTGRVYKAREYGANGQPIREIHWTAPVSDKGNIWNPAGHPLPHEHYLEYNNPANPSAGLKPFGPAVGIPVFDYVTGKWIGH